jgi:hypothetical protein
VSDDEAAPRSIRGRQLVCPVCRHTEFYSREYLLNTRLATFFKHIMWFAAEADEPE